MYIKSKNRIISDNDLVKVRCVIVSEASQVDDTDYDDEKDIEIYPDLQFTHGYTNELKIEIPSIIRNNLDKIVDRYSTINMRLEESDIRDLKLENVKIGSYLQITVIDVLNFDFKWNLSEDEKIVICKILKDRGNYKTQLNQWSDAFKNYHKAVKYLKDSVCSTDPNHSCHEIAKALLISCMNNVAVSCLKLGSGYLLCVKYCDHILNYDPNNTKALYRRAKALLELKNYESALNSLDKCLDLETDEKARQEIIDLRTKCSGKFKLQKGQDQIMCREIFDKMGEMARKGPGDSRSSIPYDIDDWDNGMADQMLSITEELEAFGEEMPPRININSRNGETFTIVEEDDFE